MTTNHLSNKNVITTSELINATIKNLESPDLEEKGQKALPKILAIVSKCICHTFSKLDENSDLRLALCNLPYFGEFSRCKGYKGQADSYNFNPSKYMQL